MTGTQHEQQQIGANDGLMADPLSPVIFDADRLRLWRGVLVEPVPQLFERLKRTYSRFRSEFVFVNAAVNATCSARHVPFYAVDAAHLAPDHWMNGLASLTIPRVHAPDLFRELSVPCLTMHELATIAREHGVFRPDALLIDVEGHDHELVQALETWPFGRPLMILFEIWFVPLFFFFFFDLTRQFRDENQLPVDAESTTLAFLSRHHFHSCQCDFPSTEDRVALDTRRIHELA